jgi:hypothetical protein
MKIKTASDLKYAHESAHPGSAFFSRESMKFAGDKMSNYGLRRATVKRHSGDVVECFELYRRRPVKHGLQSSAFFDCVTFARVHGELINGEG